MKSYPAVTVSIRTNTRSEMLDVTDRIQKLLDQHHLEDGMAIIYVPHTTAATTINENADPDVRHDMLKKLETMVPKHEAYYQHAEGNSDSHVKTSLVGNSVTVLIESGRLLLGQWQGIYFCEFDGPRSRKMIVKLVEFA